METMLLIIAVAALALILFRPAPRSQIVYVPVEIAEERGGLGCLPVVAAVILAVLALLALGGMLR